ncbi:MAG: DUF4339 domain-containing protein [Opitutales bacterium]
MWHYADGDESVGPIGEGDFTALIGRGMIRPDTLVWRSGFAAWQSAGQVAELKGRFGAAKVEGGRTATGTLELTARARPRVDLDEGHAAITLEDLRNSAAALTAEENTRPDPTALGWLIFLSPLELRFFLTTALLAGLATAALSVYQPALVFAPFLAQGILCCLLGAVIFRVQTFQQQVLWGIGGLLLGITDLVFLVLFWSRAKRPFCLSLAGLAVIGVTAALADWPTLLAALEPHL